jgi:hypothetical protein
MDTGSMAKPKKKKVKKDKQPRIIRRRIVGLWISGASRNSPPIAHAIYEEDILEETSNALVFRTKMSRGDSLQVCMHSGMMPNVPKKEREWHLKAFRPDLHYSIQAAAVLYQQIEHACLELDKEHKKGEFG